MRFFLFIACLDTVFATLNNIWLWLAQNPERRRELIAEPENIDGQVEELLRVFSVTFFGRTVRKDVELSGITLKRATSSIAFCRPATTILRCFQTLPALTADNSDNYLTLTPGERRSVEVRYPATASGAVDLKLRGWNAAPVSTALP